MSITTPTPIQSLTVAFYAARDAAISTMTTAELIGEALPSKNRYTELVEVLEHMLEDAKELQSHVHQWNDDDYCNICGFDGRA